MAERELKIYGAWAGNTKGTPEDTARCIKSVYTPGSYNYGHQCNRKRGHGKDGLYCKQHDPVRIKEIDDNKQKAYDDKWKKRQDEHDRACILAKMAEGIPTKDLKNYALVTPDEINGG